MKKGLVWLGVLFVLATAVFAQESLPRLVWDNLVWIFSLGWLTRETDAVTTLLAFVRFTIAIVTFVVVYELLMKFGGEKSTIHSPLKLKLSKQTCLIISIAISLLSSIFFPDSLLFTLVLLYSTAVAFVMITVPVFFTLLLSFGMHPKTGEEYLYGIRAALLGLAMWLLSIIATWAYDLLEFGGQKELLAYRLAAEAGGADYLAGASIDSTLSTLYNVAIIGQIVLLIAILYNLWFWYSGRGASDPLHSLLSHGERTNRNLMEAVQDLLPFGREPEKHEEIKLDKDKIRHALSKIRRVLSLFDNSLEAILTKNIEGDERINLINGLAKLQINLVGQLRQLEGIDIKFIQGLSEEFESLNSIIDSDVRSVSPSTATKELYGKLKEKIDRLQTVIRIMQ